MARSLVATEIGVKRAKDALIDLGITQTVLAEKRLKYSRSTVSNFFNRKPIAHENFTEICIILKLKWRDIAEIAEGEAIQDDAQESSATAASAKSAKQEFQQIDDKVKQVEKQIRLAFAIAGTVDQVDQAKLTAILNLLRQITNDASISIIDIQEGSIKLILTGTPEALVKIQALYRSEELTEVEGIPIEYVDLLVDESEVFKTSKKEKISKNHNRKDISKNSRRKNSKFKAPFKKENHQEPLFFRAGKSQKAPSIIPINFSGVIEEILSEAATTQIFDAQILNTVLPDVYATLTRFAGRDDFEAVMKQAFGTTYDPAFINTIRQQWLVGDFSSLPQVEILSGKQLQWANAAYARSTHTIYFSRDFLSQYGGNAEAVKSVFLEEIGHYLDWKINASDTPGDEGGVIFSALCVG